MLASYYHAARNDAAIIEQDWMGILRLTGPDRQTWLQGMVTNDVERLKPGQGCYAAHLNAQGKIVAHMTVLAGEDDLWLLLERSAVERLAAAFDKLIIMEDVQVQDLSDAYESIGVIGPRGREILDRWQPHLPPLQNLHDHHRDTDFGLVRSNLGYDILVKRELSDKVLRDLAAYGATPIDHGAWDVLRTEAGLPVYGVDIDETTMLPELGDRGISYDKGCYIGQEVVARIKYIGHVNRKFVGFVCEGDKPPELRSVVHHDGKNVGYVTTSLMSPGLKKIIALGFVSRATAAPGTSVELAGPDITVRAAVASLPFVEL